jgi:hypothetical protein
MRLRSANGRMRSQITAALARWVNAVCGFLIDGRSHVTVSVKSDRKC